MAQLNQKANSGLSYPEKKITTGISAISMPLFSSRLLNNSVIVKVAGSKW